MWRKSRWRISGCFLLVVVLCLQIHMSSSASSTLDPSQPPDWSRRGYAATEEGSGALPSGSPEHAEEEPHRKSYDVATVDFQAVEAPFIIALWLFCASLAKIGFHLAPRLSHIFPESCLLIAVGVIIGLLLFHTSSVKVSTLTPPTFFLYMLPPIILDAGYFMPNRLFFDHLGTILLFAVIGTVFNTLTIGLSLWGIGTTGLFNVELPMLHSLLFSALISAVDPVAVLAVFEEIHVDELLYIVVFGESLLNDAVTVVLYHMFEAYSEMGQENIKTTDVLAGVASFFVVAIGGTAIGVVWGFLTGFVTRFTNHVRVIEPLFVFVMAYLAYLNAEIFHMSGILAITFCGITMKNYVEANISSKSHTTVKYAMKMLSSSSETVIFMFLGVATIHNKHDLNIPFVLLTLLFCSVYRVIGVVLLSAVANRFRLQKLGKVEKFVMSYGGLRGAVAFALVLLINDKHIPLQPMFVTTTIATVYFTVFVQGISIKPLVKILKVKRAEKRKPSMNERIHERVLDHVMAGVEDILGKHGNYHVRDRFKHFDNKYIRPCIIRDAQGAEPKILETYSKLTMKDAMEFMRRNGSNLSPTHGGESMAALLRSYNTGSGNHLAASGSMFPLDNHSNWNRDLQELDYSPSKKDLTDAKIHHLLEEEMYKPYKRLAMRTRKGHKHFSYLSPTTAQHRRLSYSRHAVHECDLNTQPEVNYKVQMNIRRRISENVQKQQLKMLKKHKGSSPNPDRRGQPNGVVKPTQRHMTATVRESDELSSPEAGDDSDAGITFTVKGDKRSRVTLQSPENDSETIAEMSLPWRRGDQEAALTGDGTVVESELPWRRQDEDEEGQFPVRQNEFPTWCSNKDYLAYTSPTSTFLGGLGEPQSAPSVIGLFKRDSVSSLGKRDSSGSLHQQTGISGSRRSSLASSSASDSPEHEAALPGTVPPGSGRRFSSFVAVPIPEEGDIRDAKEEEEEEHPGNEHSRTKL